MPTQLPRRRPGRVSTPLAAAGCVLFCLPLAWTVAQADGRADADPAAVQVIPPGDDDLDPGAAVAALLHGMPGPGAAGRRQAPPPTGGQTNEADVDLLMRIYQGGLWEMPACQLAQQKSTSPTIQKLARTLYTEHTALGTLDQKAAARLGLTLPDAPSAAGQAALERLKAADPADFDALFVNILRGTHGKVFTEIASVRSYTRDATVRAFAQQANKYVLHHLTLLDNTGLVDYDALPPSAIPS